MILSKWLEPAIEARVEELINEYGEFEKYLEIVHSLKETGAPIETIEKIESLYNKRFEFTNKIYRLALIDALSFRR